VRGSLGFDPEASGQPQNRHPLKAVSNIPLEILIGQCCPSVNAYTDIREDNCWYILRRFVDRGGRPGSKLVAMADTVA